MGWSKSSKVKLIIDKQLNMKSVRIHQYGGPEVISFEDAPMPEITPTQVLVQVYATSFNPLDSLLVRGILKERASLQFPFTLCSDVSGVVVKTGAKVNSFKEGDKVFGFLDYTRNGAAAEYVATEAAYLANAPESITLEEAAAVPLAALTAWQGLFEHINLQPGQRILINNASGGVGNYAVQLAKWKGGYVIGTSGPDNLDLVKSFGADEAIDYRKGIESGLSNKVDAIFNLVAADQSYMNGLLDFIKDGGTIISSVVPASPELAAGRHIRSSAMWVHPDSEALKRIAGLIDNNIMKINITQTFPLEKLSEVHKLSLEGKTNGKILVRVKS